ncbi:MAG TPA: hypothetical protein VKU02_33730 [Gemmataceae bacterium]|nr:hypothetical protein [Gemmataceae bacterium]
MPSWFLHSLAVYGAVCLVSLLFGSAVLRLLRPGLTPTLQFCLAPVVTAACWAWMLSLGIRMGHTVRSTSTVAWILTLVVAGAETLLQSGPWLRVNRWVLAACMGAPVLALAAAFWQGLDVYTNSQLNDNWVYSALGRHAWKYHFREQIPDGLRPIYAFIAGPRQDRVVGPALEGFFSWLYVPGEIQTGINLYTAHSFFMLCCAVAAFALSLGLRIWAVVTAVLLVACSHWLGNVVYLGNLDQCFGLAYLPACLVLAGGPAALDGRSAALAGILLGAVAMAYPPGLFLVLGPAVAAWAWRVLREGCPCGRAVGQAALTLLAFLLFLNAEMRVLVFETRLQLNAAMAGSGHGGQGRPGELLLPGMLGKARLPALFGMGSEWGPEGGTYALPSWAARLRQMLAVAACITLLAGFCYLFRAGRPDLMFSAAVLISGTVYFLVKEHYPYGAMKILTFIWPVLLVAAVVAAAAALRLRVRMVGIGLAIASLLSVAWCESPGWVPKAFPAAAIPSHSYREYHLLKERLHALTGGAPIVLGVQNVVTYLWLEYFLCDEPVCTLLPANPSSVLMPLLGGWPNVRRPALPEAHHLITDGPNVPAGVGGTWVRVYESPSFSLWKQWGWEGS